MTVRASRARPPAAPASRIFSHPLLRSDPGGIMVILHMPTCILNEDTQPVMRAIGESHTACKDEFRQNNRPHSWLECISVRVIYILQLAHISSHQRGLSRYFSDTRLSIHEMTLWPASQRVSFLFPRRRSLKQRQYHILYYFNNEYSSRATYYYF